jgi:hypothetical protein
MNDDDLGAAVFCIYVALWLCFVPQMAAGLYLP